MTNKPTLPKTRQSFDGLSELIDQSIAQKEKFGAMLKTSEPDSLPNDSSQGAEHKDALIEKHRQTEGAKAINSVERFQITAPSSVIVATKIEALKRNTTAAAIVELALRQYLNLPQID